MSVTPLVSTSWLADHLDEPDVRLVDATTVLEDDANTGRLVHEAGHIPGAAYAELLHDLNDSDTLLLTVPPVEQFEAAAGRLGIGDGTHVVVYDQGQGSTKWAARLWWQLRYEGFERVSVLDGGFRAWVEEERAVALGIEEVVPGQFTSARRPELLATVPDVLAAIVDPATLLVDSRGEAAYRGTAARGYRSGHIPTAVHVFEGAHTADGTFDPVDEVRGRFAAIGALDPTTRVVTYCGGGVSAAQNALALAVAGRTDVAVYDGSMLEWGTDPSLPLVLEPQ